MPRLAAALIALTATIGANPPLTAFDQTDALRIVVIEGEDAVNIVQQTTAVAPVVEVRDRNNQPVAGALVRLAINQGRGTFAGARTLSVTTNAAGRAVATGLTPTGAGGLQIGASATFQGQTVVATITQTNVMTAAEAAAAGASGTGASGGASGAAGSGGGGVSGTTLGVVGGAVAGGALVAVSAAGGGEEVSDVTTTTYRGSFSMQSVYNSDTFTNGVVTGFCHNQVVTIPGNITVTLDEHGTGDITMEWTLDKAAAGQCPGNAPGFSAQGPASSAANLSLSYDASSNYESPAGTVRQRNTMTFSGALVGNAVTGIVRIAEDLTLIAPAASNITVTGGFPAVSAAVTLTKQ
jgi:hypothetical protein